MPRYRFSEFVVSPNQRRLLRNGEELPLIPRYFDLLVFLIERRHEAVHRRDIFDRVWSDVIVSDSALSQAIRTIRRTLGDDPREPRFIRTVSRHGYRFVFADVIEEEDGDVRPARLVEQNGEHAESARLAESPGPTEPPSPRVRCPASVMKATRTTRCSIASRVRGDGGGRRGSARGGGAAARAWHRRGADAAGHTTRTRVRTRAAARRAVGLARAPRCVPILGAPSPVAVAGGAGDAAAAPRGTRRRACDG